MNEQRTVVTCTYCGRLIENNPTENVSFAEHPYPHDEGFGACRDCGGDPSVSKDDHSPEALKKRLGLNAVSFYEARFEIVQKALSPENLAKFEAMDYAQKIAVIARLIEKGAMI